MEATLTESAPASRRSWVRGRVRGHLRSPLIRSGYALVLSSAITGGLGLPYWLLASRLYSPAAVGQGAAIVAALLLVTSLATAGVKRGLLRFVPEAGAHAGKLVTRTYLAVMAVSAAAALVFVLGAGIWADNLVLLRSSGLASVVFVLAAGVWAVFILQDAVLVATRHSWGVPLENAAFSVAKIVLLIALASTAAAWGIVLSWAVPAAVAAVGVTLWLSRRPVLVGAEVAPAAVGGARPDSLPTLKQLLRFVGPQHFAALLWYATLSVIPLMVIDRLGAAHNAHYYVAEQVAFGLFLLSSNVTDALVAEGAADPKSLRLNLRRAVWQVLFMLVLPLVALVAFAPQVMGLFGAGYRSEATTLLRLLALAALPNTVNTFVVGLAAIRLRMSQVVAMEGAAFGVTLTLTWVFLGRWGLTGVGWAFLLSQTVVATAALLVAAARSQAVRQGPRAMVVAGLRAGRGRLRSVRSRATARRLLAELGTARLPAADADWSLLTSGHDVIVLSAPGMPSPAVVRLAAGTSGRSSIQRHRRGIATVHSDSRLTALAGQVPRPLDHATDDTWMVETVGAGLPASVALSDAATAARAGRALVSACDQLHSSTARRLEVGAAELEAWIERPAATLAGVVRRARSTRGLAAMTAHLRAELEGREVTVTRVHGDLSGSNVLLTDDSSEVSAILDWESAAEALPELDLMQFVLDRRWETAGGELGSHVVDVLRDGWTDAERSLLSSSWSVNAAVSQRTMVVLAWLAHVSQNLDKTNRYRDNRWWVRHNVDVVLRELARGGALDVRATATTAPASKSQRWWTPTFRSVMTKQSWPTAVLVVGGVVAWLAGAWGIRPGAMSDLGLLSILRPPAYVGLGLLILAFGVEVGRRQPATWRLAAPLAVFVGLVHGTPAVLYGTLRYSWAWKHIGIIDYIQRHGTVDPHIAHLNVYQNWPGFFAVSAALSSLFGIGAPVHAARWWPVLANLAVIPVLLLIYRGLGGDRRRSWTAVAFFLTANWVGQDYFSPQSFAFLLYLGVIAVVVNRLRRDTGKGPPVVGETRAWSANWVWLVLCLAIAAIVSSHQITPFMLVVALGALLVTRRVRTFSMGIATVGMTAVWAFTAASPFIHANFPSLIASVGKPAANTDRNLVDQGRLSGSQVLVSNMGRAVVALIAIAAAVGIVRCLRRRQLDGVALALTISPAALVLANDFDGEIVFRTFLFAVPLLAWYAALAVWSPAGEARTAWWSKRLHLPVVTDRWRATVAVAFAATLLAGFLFSYYGKERWYYFSHDEVAASNLVFSHAPAGSLLVAGTGDFPLQWKRYENLTYVFIAAEPADGRARLLAHPADTLAGWLADRRYRDTYLLITRSQKAEVEATGALPLGSLDRIERALLRDGRFNVLFRSPNATVFGRPDRRQG